MICEEKVLLESTENARRYRGEVVARISGSGSKSMLDMLEETEGSREDEPILSGGGHSAHGPGRSATTHTPTGYERHVTPSFKQARLPHLHGLEPASSTRRRMEGAGDPIAADGRTHAGRTLAFGDCEYAGAAEAVLREAAALAEMRSLFADAERDKNEQLDRAELRRLAATVLGVDLGDEALEHALAEMDGDDDGLITFDDFKQWIGSLKVNQQASARPG